MTLAPSGAAPVLFEERHGVLVITINRPEVCNAANAAVAYAVSAFRAKRAPEFGGNRERGAGIQCPAAVCGYAQYRGPVRTLPG